MPDRLFEPEIGEVSPGVACETRIEPLTDSEPETLASAISAWALEPRRPRRRQLREPSAWVRVVTSTLPDWLKFYRFGSLSAGT